MLHWSWVREPRLGRPLRGDVRTPDGPPPRSAVVIVHGFKGFFTDLEGFARNTFSRELEDLADVVSWVRSGELVPRVPRRVGLLGHSRGGADVILHAGAHGGVDALATWGAVATFDRWSEETQTEWREAGRIYVLNSRTGQQMPLDVGLLEDLEANRGGLDVEAAAAAVEAPWLVVHGHADETVSFRDAHALAGRGRRTRLLLVDGAGHTFGATHPFTGPTPALESAMEATVEHFRTHLQSEGG